MLMDWCPKCQKIQNMNLYQFDGVENENNYYCSVCNSFIKNEKVEHRKFKKMKIISIREQPNYVDIAIPYFQSKWANRDSMMIYEDCIKNCIDAMAPLPQWYLLYGDGEIVGCAGLVPNDFISRMDLYPWLCALYIEKQCRGSRYGSLLIKKAKEDANKAGFPYLYLSTDHIGYYEHYGFEWIGMGYHPWGKQSRIYQIKVSS